MKADVSKILPSLTSDLTKTIYLYNPMQFFQDILLILIKKLIYLFGDNHNAELNKTVNNIFVTLIKHNWTVSVKENYYNHYKIFNECLMVVGENSIRSGSACSVLELCIKYGFKIFMKKEDIIKCLNTFYLDIFIYIFKEKNDLFILEIKLNEALKLFEIDNKYVVLSYSYFNHMLRVYIENAAEKFDENKWIENFPPNIQVLYLKIILLLANKMDKTEQLSKCDNCKYKSGLHDSLRLCFVTKVLISNSIKHEMDVSTLLPMIIEITKLQVCIINKLKENKCVNIEKYEFKSQTNIHNTAILLYKSKYFEFSLQLFEIYLRNEFQENKDKKSVARGLYNKAICELDAKKYKQALVSAFLSLIFSFNGNNCNDKYMSLVIDIKSKSQDNGDEEKSNYIVDCTILDACRLYNNTPIYGCLKNVFVEADFW